jgi:hypothetical protein
VWGDVDDRPHDRGSAGSAASSTNAFVDLLVDGQPAQVGQHE